jgi:hypothetical protein
MYRLCRFSRANAAGVSNVGHRRPYTTESTNRGSNSDLPGPCGLLPHSKGSGFLFSLLSLFFFPWCFLLWVFSALLVLSDAPSFFLVCRRALCCLGLFHVGLFHVRTFFFVHLLCHTEKAPDTTQRRACLTLMVEVVMTDPFGDGGSLRR